MKKSKLSILLLFLVMILAISAVSAADDTNDTSDAVMQAVDEAPLEEVASDSDVVGATDDTDIIADEGNNFTSLQTLIENSQYDFLPIDKDYTRVEGDQVIEINRNFALLSSGGNYKIDANNLGGIFKVKEGVTFVLQGLTLVNGNSTNGGAIYNEGTLQINSGTILENNAAIEGGAIYNKGTLTITGSDFNQNTAVNAGGAIYSENGVTIIDSNFNANTVTNDFDDATETGGSQGGAIYVTGDKLEITGSKFNGNEATPNDHGDGAAIYAKVTTTTISNTEFTNNKGFIGGAVYLIGADQETPVFDDCLFEGNTALQAGAISLESAKNFKINNSRFINNKAVSDRYIGSYNDFAAAAAIGAADGSNSNIYVDNSKFTGNTVTSGPTENSGFGAAIITTGSLFVDNSEFSNNVADKFAAIRAYYNANEATVTITNSNFTSNKATKGNAAAIYTSASKTTTVTGSRFVDNEAAGNGGAIYADGALTVEDSYFSGNKANNTANAIYANDRLVLSGNTIEGDEAEIIANGDVISQINVTILNNDTVEIFGTLMVNATVIDGSGNLIADINGIKFVIDGAEVEAVYNATTGVYEGLMTLPEAGIYSVNAIYSDDINVKTATIKNSRGTFKDLQQLVDVAEGTLNLTYNFRYTPELGDTATDGIVVGNALTINGNGYTISGSNATRIFKVTAATTINNVTIADGYYDANYGGAAIYATAALTVTNTNFTNNGAEDLIDKSVYGAVRTSTSASFDNCVFTNNYGRWGGAIGAEGSGTITIKNSKFENNNARQGGAIDIEGYTLKIDNTEFIGNDAVMLGGAVHTSQGTVATVTNSKFERNTDYQGGAICSKGSTGSLTVDNSEFIANEVTGTEMPVKETWSSGGAIWVENKLTLTNSNFTANKAEYNGGAVYVQDGAASATIDNCRFENNKAGVNYGAIVLYASTNKVSNSYFDNNSANGQPNAITLNKGNLELSGNTIEGIDSEILIRGGQVTSQINITVMDNDTYDYSFKAIDLYAAITDNKGNVITDSGFKFLVGTTEVAATFNPETNYYEATYNPTTLGTYVVNMTSTTNDNLVIKTATLRYIKGTYTDLQNQIDKAIEDGVDLELAYNFTYNEEFDSALIKGIVIDHAVTINGYGYTIDANNTARIFNVNSTLTLNNVTVCNGVSQDYGGAVYVNENASLVAEDVSFINNTAINQGGAIFSWNDITIKEGTKFINNTANTGGAIYIYGDIDITGATFTENTAEHVAGAILVAGEQINIKDSSFNKNSASGYDAGAIKISHETATTTISSTSFTDNSAVTTGGAITAYGGNLVINENCKFTGNTAKNGGAVYCYGNIKIDDSEFADNNAADGGAIYYNINGNLTVTGSKFIDNTANYGGAIENEGSGILTASDCNFTNNTATVRGGAIISSGNTSVSDSVFADNKATDNSNAIYLYVPDTTLKLSNNEINGSDDAQIFVKEGVQVVSPLKVIILNNGTYNITTISPYNITAVVTDLKGNLIVDNAFRFVVGDTVVDNIEINATTGVYTATFTPSETGSFVVSTNLEDTSSIETAVLNIFRTFSDLQALIDADTTGSITLNGDYIYNEEFDSALTKGIVINKDITINGNGYTIDGNNMQHIFSIYNGDVELDNITFANSVCDDGVGAVYTNTSLTVSNSLFINNTATNNYANGAAIMAEATGSEITLNIHNTVFKDNTIDNGGAAVTVATPDNNKVIYNIYDSTFENNVAINTAAGANVAGGAIFSYGNTEGYINNTIFRKNKAVSDYLANGGAIKVQFGGTLTVANSTFENNTAGHAGGAISVQANTGMDNALTVDTCTFTGNVAADGGAAIASAQNVGESDVTVINSNFDESNAVYLDAKTTAEVSDSVLTGADNAITSLGNLKLTNNTISSIIINNGTINGIVTVFDSNATYKEQIILTATFTDGNGNLIYDSDLAFIVDGDNGIYNATYENGVYTANYTANKIGMINVTVDYVGDKATINKGLLNVSKANVTLTVNGTDIVRKDDETISIKLVDYYGNPIVGANVNVAVYLGSEMVNTTVLVTDINGTSSYVLSGLGVGNYNIIALYGGNEYYKAPDFPSTNVFVVDELNYTTTFTELQEFIKTYEGTNDTLVLPYDYIYNDWADEDKYINGVKISKDITIDGNGTTIDANKTARIFYIEPGVIVTIKNVTFINGKADEGAAIYTNAELLDLVSCIFYNNDPSCGGAIFVATGTTVDVNGTYQDNAADFGGAIYVDAGANLIVDQAAFNNNEAIVGGAIYSLGNVTVYDSTFTANEAMGAGAIYVLDRNNDVNLIVSGSTFDKNVAGDAGAGILLDASEGYGVSYTITDSVFTSNIIMTNTSVACGAAIYSEGNAIGTVKGSTFTNNTAISNLSAGGAIRVQYEGVATIEDCTFAQNVAYAGGAIGLQANTGKTPSVTVNNCTFTENVAAVGGGAISAVSNVGASEIFVYNSTFENNIAGNRGGAIFGDKATTIYVSGSDFNENVAVNQGGAINARGDLAVVNSTFANNNVSDGGAAIAIEGTANTASYIIAGSTFDNNFIDEPDNPAGAGGAIYAVGTTEGVIYDCLFTNNSVFSNGYANGGAIKIEFAGKSTIRDSTFIDNKAALSGGAIDLQANATGYPDVTIDNCTFERNYAQAGGAVASLSNVGEGTLTIINSTFNNNRAAVAGGAVYSDKSTKTTISGSEFVLNDAPLGGAIYALKDLTVNEYTFFESNAAELGGAIYVAAKYDDASLTVKDVIFFDNFVTDGGAAIAIKADGKVATYDISDSEFDKNTMDDPDNPAGCGAVYIVGTAEGTFTNDVFTRNSASSNGLANGGAIKLEFGAKATIKDSYFEDNNATVSGGAIDLQSDVGMNPEAEIINCTFVNNQAAAGGAIACLQNPGTGNSSVTVIDSHFIANNAAYGGAIYSDDFSTVNVSGSEFNSNDAEFGGAIYSLNNLTVKDSAFDKQTAEGGAAIFVADKYTTVFLSVDNCTFADNAVSNAGGAILVDATYGNMAFYAISDSTFTDNIALNSDNDACVAGGAIYAEGTSIGTITNDVFIGNKADSPLYPNGGAIKAQFGAQMTIFGCTFEANEAGLSGGAIDVQAKAGDSCYVMVANSKFKANKAPAGAAIASLQNNGNSTVKIYNCTFEDDLADLAGVVYFDDLSDVSISNSNITSDSVAIYNIGNLSLSNNVVDTVIYNGGNIITPTYIKVLDNTTTTEAVDYGDTVELYAEIVDDNNNTIVGKYDLAFMVEGDNGIYNATFNADSNIYVANYTTISAGKKAVSAKLIGEGLLDNSVQIGILNISRINITEFNVIPGGQDNRILYGENVTIYVTLRGLNGEGLNETFTVVVNNTEYSVTVNDGEGSFNVSGLEPGEYAALGMFPGNNDYNSAYATGVFYVISASNLTVVPNATTAVYGDEIIFWFNVTDSLGNPIDAGIVVIDDTYKVIIEDGLGYFDVNDQPDVGNYTLTAVFIGDEYFASSSAVFTFEVIAKEINTSDIDYDFTGDYPDGLNITINAPVDGTYIVDIEGYGPVTVEVNNGTGSAIVNIEEPGDYDANISIADGNYSLKPINKQFKYKAAPEYTVNITGTYPNAKVTIEGTDGNYSVYIDEGHQLVITVKDGVGSQEVSGLFAGEYKAHVEFEEQDRYHSVDSWVNFTIDKAPLDIDDLEVIGDKVVESPINITFTLPADVDPLNVSAYMDGVPVPVDEFIINETTGVYTLPLDGFAAAEGHYFVVQVTDPDYEDAIAEVSFLIEKAESTVTIEVDGEIGVMGGATVNVTVSNNAAGYIKIDNDGVIDVVEITDGTYSFEIFDLQAGDYYINVTFLGNDKYLASSAIKEFNVPQSVINPNITDVTSPILEGQDAVITVTMDNDFATGNVTVFVDNEEYDVFVLDDASAIIEIIGLTEGTHTIVVQYNGDDNYKSDKNATVDITVYGNVVTNETFLSYFDEDGVLRDNVPFDELIFSGEFSDLGITHVIVDNIAITGDDAKLTNIGFVANGNVALSNMTLIADTSLGGLIYVAEDDVVITGMDISYTVGDEDAVAIDVTGVNNVIISDSKITFASKVAKDTLEKSAMAINIFGSSNVDVYGSVIDTTLIGVDANYGTGGLYDMYGMMGVGNVNPVRILDSSEISFSFNNVTSKLSDIQGYYPTIQSVLVVASKDLEFEGNNFTMIDDVTAAGTPSYLYSFTFGMNDGVDLYYNNFFMSTEGGATATGTAYALQIVSSNMTIIGNNITSISNGPNLGIYAVCDYNTFDDFELYIADNIINVTGKVTSTTTWNDLLSGIEIGHGDVEIEGNTINVYNKAGYIEGSYVYGISYAQRVYAPTFSISDNTVIVPDATYAIGIYHTDDVTATENYLIAHDLYGDQAVYVNGSEAVIEENYPQDLNITITVENCTVSDPVEISVTTNPLFNGQITVTIGTADYIINIIDGEGSDMLDSVPANTYNVVASYAGDTYFKADEDNATLVVSRLVSNITITTGDVVVDAPLVVNVTMEYVDGNVTVIVDGNKFPLALDTGLGTFTIPKENMTAGDHSITVIFAGDDTYDPADATYNFTVEKAEDYEFDVNLTIDEIDIGENVTINVTLPEDANGNITVTVDGKPVTFENVVNGTATVTVPADAFTAGRNNTIAVTYSDDKYGETTVTKEIPVNKLPYAINATADNIELGQNATIIINVPAGADGKATVELQGNFYPAVNGTVILEGLGEGTYTANVYFFDDSVYEDNHTTVTFNVTKVEITPEQAFNFTTPENSTSEVISVNLPEDATGFLLLDINGTQTHVPLVNGTANVTVPNLAEGTYNATITYTGDDKYAPISTTKEINVTSNVPENALNIPAGSKSDEPTTYSISLPSDAGGFLMVDVDGTKYAAPLNNGSASVTIPALSAGSHNVTVTYTGDDKYSPVTKATTLNVTAPVFKITNNKNVAAVYSAKATYKVLITRDGKAVGAGEAVTFKYNGKTYTVKTDSKGYATFKPSTKVKVKKYTVTATYKGVSVKNTVTIKHVIKAKNKKVKKSKKVNKVVITLKKVNKKYLKKKTIKVKFKGKTYKVKTNKKGKATWKVKKSVLKKLKVGKKYKYKVTYGKDKVTKKLTIKK